MMKIFAGLAFMVSAPLPGLGATSMPALNNASMHQVPALAPRNSGGGTTQIVEFLRSLFG